MIFAETNPADLNDPAFLSFLKGLVIFLSVVTNIGLGWRVMSGKKDNVNISPQPFQVEKAKQFVTVDEFDSLKKQVSDLSAKMDGEYRGIIEAGSRREASIKKMITDVKDVLVDKMDEMLKEAYHRINHHGERIARTEAKLGMTPPPMD